MKVKGKPYLGDFKENSVIDFKWGSYDSNGASITRTVDGTISVYKSNSVTQSVAGVTDTEDFDGLTGIHHVRIDTADVFYATGEDYEIVLSGATIDGQTVNAVLALFSIENRSVDARDLKNTIERESSGTNTKVDTHGNVNRQIMRRQ